MKLTPEEKAALTEPCVDLPLPEVTGLTRRELFAMQALQGLLAADGTYIPSRVESAKRAVEFADALIAELAKKS